MGFFKNLFGLEDRKTHKSSGSTGNSSTILDAPVQSTIPQAIPASMADSNGVTPAKPLKPIRPVHQTEAYQSRKMGRKAHSESHEDLKRIIAGIERRGEAKPGELAEELGMSRSTLAYNLKRLMLHRPDFNLRNLRLSETGKLYRMKAVLGQKRLVKLGAGPNVRYRLVDIPQTDTPMKSAQPSLKSGIEAQTQGAGSPSEAPPQGQEGPK